ncbi:TlpA family protein disulfide reductase [Candidatus Aalborgicola defluviihabitans]|jgi:thiol-disulfide isomerase/thioredoxin|uniref:TlpA family protein disulfide reductase n=1 Tax=Candidatus Aalborgicola defluviihabitans TaxID=3386187 RepID=UPI001DBF44B3|nr:TlpA family protein disulfide reductase [Burkholderiales bacterium]MBK6570823.1 TlpA family protein disulfide reductase [Burkholderiales bacterium]MBK7279816.1 TlpA family protein disulfide reductase [Burkholderiales bacterium]MBK7312496.1 TlpA family protein disulfide reductase [Burkholderiales bacterium]MBL0243305.1 TlpA family protein disulfide reductase [Rhodoferax sp.]
MNAPNPNPSPPQAALSDTRRRLLLGGTAVAAGLAGGSAAWWRLHVPDGPPPSAPTQGFWDHRFDTPDGSTVAIRSFQGQPLLVNFWATWCTPCVEELPLINNFYRENKANGWQVLGLAIDKPAPVRAFLQKMPLDFPIGLAGLTGAELSRGLGNLVGGLPFSVVLGRDGMVLQRKMGRITPDDLSNWLRLK